MLAFLLLISCAKEVPPHLRVNKPVVAKAEIEASLASLVRHDPLLRRPDPLTPEAWKDIPNGHAIETWARVARTMNASPSDWMAVETATSGTVGVPLARGARLAALEVITGDLDEALQKEVAAWLGLTRVQAQPGTSTPRQPLDWVEGRTPDEKRKTVIHMAERSVLEGWFEHPQLDIQPAATAIEADAHTGIASSPYGQLLQARALRLTDPDAGRTGRRFLHEATLMALKLAAADTDREQASVRVFRDEEEKRLGAPPVAWNLEKARKSFTQDAASVETTGLALVTIGAERLENSCPDTPCGGLDRVASITRASSWGKAPLASAAAWHVIALKRALDTLEVSLDKPTLGRRLPQVADTLAGIDETQITLPFLRYRVAAPGLLVSISRMADGPPTSDQKEALQSVKNRLLQACDNALNAGVSEEQAKVIQHIQRRTAGR